MLYFGLNKDYYEWPYDTLDTIGLKFVDKYVQDNYKWVAKGKKNLDTLFLEFIDHQIDATSFWTFYKLKIPDKTKEITLINRLFLDYHKDQVNMVIVYMDETEEGQALLSIVRTKQFDTFPGGVDTVFEPIQVMFDIVTNR